MAKQGKKHLITEIITFVAALVTFIFAVKKYLNGKKKPSKKKR